MVTCAPPSVASTHRPRERVDVELAVGERRDDRVREAERPAAVELRLGARGADDARAERGRELERGGTDAGADRVHEHPFAGLELGLGHERVVRGHERLGRAAHRRRGRARRAPARTARPAPRRTRPARRRRRCRTRGRRPRRPSRSRADRLDDAGELEARDVGRRAGRRGIVARELEEVGPVEAGAVHPHDHEVVERLRDRAARRPRSARR